MDKKISKKKKNEFYFIISTKKKVTKKIEEFGFAMNEIFTCFVLSSTTIRTKNFHRRIFYIDKQYFCSLEYYFKQKQMFFNFSKFLSYLTCYHNYFNSFHLSNIQNEVYYF